MFTLAQRDELLLQFEAEAKTNYESATPKVREAMQSGDADQVREGVKFLQQLVIAAIPENIPVPKASLYVNSSGVHEITLVNIAMSNRVNATENFKYRCAFGLTEDVNEKMFRFLQEVYADLIVIELVKFNLKTVNDVLARASAEAGLQYSIRVIPAIGSAAGKKIMSMSDDEIVFVANTERTLELDDMIIFFQEPDEVFSEEGDCDGKQESADDADGECLADAAVCLVVIVSADEVGNENLVAAAEANAENDG